MAETTIMDITQTTFNREVNKVFESGPKKVFWKYKAQLWADKTKVNVFYFSGMNIERDYINKFTESICVDLILNNPEYQRVVLPNRYKLRVRIFKEPIANGSGKPIPGKIETQEFVAMLYDNQSGLMEGAHVQGGNIGGTNNANLVTVRIFLLNKTIENLRLVTLGTNVRETNVMEAIRGLLQQKTSEAASKVGEEHKGVDRYSVFNDVVRKQIPLSHTTPLIGPDSVIRKLEYDSGGIYNSGFNYFYQQGFWYLYPPFDTARYKKPEGKTLTVINLPKDRFKSVEISYRETPDQLIVLGTGATIHDDKSGPSQKNEGNAVTFMDSTRVMNKYFSMDGEDLIVNAKDNINKFGLSEEDRTTNNKEVVLKNKGISLQYHDEYMRLALRIGMLIGVVWENSKPELIYPGMPVLFMYLDKDQPRQVNGTVVSTSAIVLGQGAGGMDSDRKFVTNTMISIFIANKIDIRL